MLIYTTPLPLSLRHLTTTLPPPLPTYYHLLNTANMVVPSSSKPKLKIDTNVAPPQSPAQEIIAPATPVTPGASVPHSASGNASQSPPLFAPTKTSPEDDLEYLTAKVERKNADLADMKREHEAFTKQFYELIAASEKGGPEAEKARRKIKAIAAVEADKIDAPKRESEYDRDEVGSEADYVLLDIPEIKISVEILARGALDGKEEVKREGK